MKYIKLIIFTICFVTFFVQCSGDARVQKELEKYAEEQNAVYPIKIDDVTTLNSCEALPNKTLRYNYNILMDKSQVDTLLVKASLKVSLLSLLKVDPGTAYLRKSAAIFEYRYYDYNGNYAFQLVISPEDYKQK